MIVCWGGGGRGMSVWGGMIGGGGYEWLGVVGVAEVNDVQGVIFAKCCNE